MRAVAEKEFLELRRNQLFFCMTILASVILYFLFVYGYPLDPKHIPIAVVDMDKSVLSRSLIDDFANTSEIFRVEKVAGNYKEVMNGFNLGNIRMILVIPENFSRDLKKSRPVNLQLFIDATTTNSASLINNYASSIIGSFRAELLSDYFIKNGLGPKAADAVDLKVSGWYNSSFRSEDFLLPGIIAIVMMFFPPLVAAISLAKEKETGSILNMYCSSVTRAEYLFGKMLPYVVISFLICLLCVALAVKLSAVPMRGSLILLITSSFLFVSACIALGLLIAVLVNTQIAAILITSMATLTPTFLYSGFVVPVSNIGEGSQFMSYLIPATFYIDLARKVMVKGVGFHRVHGDFLALIAFCAGLYFLSVKLFKKRLG